MGKKSTRTKSWPGRYVTHTNDVVVFVEMEGMHVIMHNV